MLSHEIERRIRYGSLREADLLGLQQFAQSPAFNLTTLGVGLEATAGVAVAPTSWLSCQDVTFTGTNNWIERTAARGDVGREEAATGEFSGAGNITFDAEPDVLGPMLAAVMGAEQVAPNTNNPAASVVNTTTTSAVSPGSYVVIPVTATTNISVGDWLTLDTAANLETVQVAQVGAGNQITVYSATKSHASGVAVANATVPQGYDHTYTMAIPRKTITFQQNRVTDAVNRVGNKVGALDLTAANRQILGCRITTTYLNEAHVASPATAAFSTLNPFRFNDPGNSVQVAGSAADAGVLGWTLQVNNGLLAPEFTFGGGRFASSIPEGQTRVSGTMNLQFTSGTAQSRFWGSTGSTGPQSVVQPVTLQFTWVGANSINRAVKYQLVITLAKVKFTSVPTQGRAGGLLNQTVNWEAYASGLQTQDDVKFVLTNTASAVS